MCVCVCESLCTVSVQNGIPCDAAVERFQEKKPNFLIAFVVGCVCVLPWIRQSVSEECSAVLCCLPKEWNCLLACCLLLAACSYQRNVRLAGNVIVLLSQATIT